MDNQLPENNAPQGGSEKPENVFQSVKKPKIPKWVNWVVLGVVVLFVGGVVWQEWQSPISTPIANNPINSRDACQQNSDCVVVQNGCCGCNGGGKNIVINKGFLEKYNNKIEKECKDTGCVAVISEDPSCRKTTIPVCNNNKCELAVKKEETNRLSPAQEVFFYKEECEQKTGKSCSFHNCALDSSGKKTFEEVCGKDFKKGWIPKKI